MWERRSDWCSAMTMQPRQKGCPVITSKPRMLGHAQEKYPRPNNLQAYKSAVTHVWNKHRQHVVVLNICIPENLCKLLTILCTNPTFTLSSKSCDVKALITLNPISAESLPLNREWKKDPKIYRSSAFKLKHSNKYPTSKCSTLYACIRL